MEAQPLKIAIVGGGIGGLSLALCLVKLIPNYESYIKIDIYESTSSLLAQVGTGIGVWPFIWGILQELGLEEELSRYTPGRQTDDPADLLLFRKADENPSQDLFTMTSSSGVALFFHRGDFQKALISRIPSSVTIHTNKRLKTYSQDKDGIVLYFADGTTAESDILVGADGVRSPVRKTLVQETVTSPITSDIHPSEARWAGLVTYRSLIPKEKLVEQGWPNHRGLSSWTLYTGKGAALMAYPVSNGSFVNFIGFKLWPEHDRTQMKEETVTKILCDEGYESAKEEEEVETTTSNHEKVAAGDVWAEGGQVVNGKRVRWFSRVSPEEVKHIYGGWEPEVQALVNGVESPIRWAVHAVPKLKSYSHKKVCLLGDSAHAMPPQQGVGGASAICDSYVLANLFASTIVTDPTSLSRKAEDILDVYDKIRRPIADDVAAASRACAYQFSGVIQEGFGEQERWRSVDMSVEEEVKKYKKAVTDGWCYVWEGQSVQQSVDRAIEMLRTRC